MPHLITKNICKYPFLINTNSTKWSFNWENINVVCTTYIGVGCNQSVIQYTFIKYNIIILYQIL